LIKIDKDAGSLYTELTKSLRQYIIEKGLTEGQRFLSHREISELAQVSRVTARLATKQLEKEGILESHGGQGTYVRRLPSETAPDRGRRITRQIGVVLSKWDQVGALSWNDARMMPGILDSAHQNCTGIQLISHEMATGNPEQFDRYIQDRELNGLIWLSMRYPVAATAARWAERGLPQVAGLSRLPNLKIPLVTEDNRGAASQAVRRVLAEGHQRVLTIYADPHISSNGDRLAGVKEELGRQNVSWPKDHFLEIPEWPHPPWLSTVIREALSSVKPTAVLMLGAATPELVQAAKALGLKVGVDLRLISFHPPLVVEGEKPEQFTYFWPQLKEIGSRAVDLLLRTEKEMERDRDLRPDWVETVAMDMVEYPSNDQERNVL